MLIRPSYCSGRDEADISRVLPNGLRIFIKKLKNSFTRFSSSVASSDICPEFSCISFRRLMVCSSPIFWSVSCGVELMTAGGGVVCV